MRAWGFKTTADGRTRFVTALAAIGFCVLSVRLVQLALLPPEVSYGSYRREVHASRGGIFDRAGNPLAIEVPARQVILDPSLVGEANMEATVAALADTLRITRDAAWKKVRSGGRKYVNFGVYTDRDIINDLATNKVFSGNKVVLKEDISRRIYPLERQLNQVIGFVDSVGNPKAGVEQYYDSYLRGTNGLIIGRSDARGREIRSQRISYTEPQPGCSVFLTIDQNIQSYVEQALDKAMASNSASAAWSIVMDCRTGDILAMASRPNANPGFQKEYDAENWRNRVISHQYDPGSVMKPLTIAAAMNVGAINTNTLIDCEQGQWHYGGRVLTSHGKGIQAAPYIIKKSCNIGTAKVALRLGKNGMHTALKAAGFSSKTGIGLPMEYSGYLDPVRTWYDVKLTRVAIGQGITVTALQLARLYCAIANGGYLMEPHIIKKIEDAQGNVVFERVPKRSRMPLFKPKVSEQMIAMLEGVTASDGTGRRAAIPGYRVAGKTGTAQIYEPAEIEKGTGRVIKKGCYSSTDYNSTFIGFLPAECPAFVVLVTVERPQPLHGGGAVAAPVFSEIGEKTARFLNIPPTTGEVVERQIVWEQMDDETDFVNWDTDDPEGVDGARGYINNYDMFDAFQ